MDIRHIFPDALILHTPINDPQYVSFYHEQSNYYIHIPKRSMTKREIKLLETFLTPVQAITQNRLNQTAEQQKWYAFFYNNGPLPDFYEKRVRFIHFYIQQKMNQREFIGTIQTFLQEGMNVVWLNENNGVILETETTEPMTETDLQSLMEAIASDFYYDVYFYLGRFYSKSDYLRNCFKREQTYFHYSLTIHQRKHILKFENAFPFFLILANEEQLKTYLMEEWKELFQDDYELLSTIKLFIENNSNTSLTAKMLYLHRNSLQYRIDKFIERTSIDIKSFHGSLSVYFICLFGETMLHSQKFIQNDEN